MVSISVGVMRRVMDKSRVRGRYKVRLGSLGYFRLIQANDMN